VTSDQLKEEQMVIFDVKNVYDPFLRFIHAWNGLCVFILMVSIWLKGFISHFSNGKEIIYRFHIYVGFALTIGITLRLIWGFIGPKNAKWKRFFFLQDWIKVLKTRKLDLSAHWGHDRYASLVYLFFYFMMIYQIISGLMMAAKSYGMGPLTNLIEQSKEKIPLFHQLKEIHEIFFYISMIYVVVHVGMIILHENLNGHPIAQSMFNGKQYRKPKI
jgi:Ni/Fe-hydrogenase 1 B-type cytochrome subunit